jgi:YVTN family beta-propeller protein
VRLLTVLALAALAAGALAGATVAPAAGPTWSDKKCSRGFVHAVITGKHTCLKAGQRCNKRLDRRYHRYGFHCHTGRLARAKRTPPPTQAIGTITARIPLAGIATAVAAGEGAVWVRVGDPSGTPGQGSVQRVDPATNAVTARISVGEGIAIGAGEGAVWATNTDSDSVSRIDPGTNAVAATIPLRGTDPYGVATGAGAVWVGVQNPEGVPAVVERIDPGASTVVTSISDAPADIGPGVAVGAGAVWTAGRPAVTRLDPTTNRVVARVSVARAGDLAADTDAVWSASGIDPCCGSGLVRIDPVTNAVVATISVLDSPTSSVAIGFGAVWTTTVRRPGMQSPFVVARIDPRTNSVAGTLPLSAAGDVATGFGALWVAAGDTLLRVQPAS